MNRNSAIRRFFGAIIIPSVLLGGCSAGSGSSFNGRVESLHPDARSEVAEKVGEPIKLKIPGNAGTGYEWVIAGDLPAFLSQQGQSRFVPNDSERVGAGGDSEFIFIANKSGKGVIRFHYLRSWNKDARPVRWAEVEVTATPGGA
jgi:predicted secreted protein